MPPIEDHVVIKIKDIENKTLSENIMDLVNFQNIHNEILSLNCYSQEKDLICRISF